MYLRLLKSYFCICIVLSRCVSFEPEIPVLEVEPAPNSINLVGESSNQTGNIGPNGISDIKVPDYPSKPPQFTDKGMNSPWGQVNAPIQNKPGDRSVESYIAIIEQFDVANSYPDRYKSGGSGLSDTRCNIYAGDVMRALGIPLPTKGDLGKGHGTSKNTDPMTANASDLYKWLNLEKDGWQKIDINNPNDLIHFREHLAQGKPALASDEGHIAVLRPDNLPNQLTKKNLGEIHIAQAGKFNTNDIMLSKAGYLNSFNPEFFIND